MRRDLTARELADELDQALLAAQPFLRSATDEQWAAPSGAPGLSVGEGVLTLWYDAWVHRDDVRAALARPRDDGPGLGASVVYLRRALGQRGWTAPAGVDLDDVDPYAFVLAATGRIDARDVGLPDDVNVYA